MYGSVDGDLDDCFELSAVQRGLTHIACSTRSNAALWEVAGDGLAMCASALNV